MTITACSLAAKKLKEQEAEDAYEREIEQCIWNEMFVNLKRHALPSQITYVDSATYEHLMED